MLVLVMMNGVGMIKEMNMVNETVRMLVLVMMNEVGMIKEMNMVNVMGVVEEKRVGGGYYP